MVVLNLGWGAFDDAEPQHWVRELRELAPEMPIVILSDRDSPEDVVSAFQSGVRGFIPNSTEPAVALQALTFLMNGGSFFPPTALMCRPSRPGPDLDLSLHEAKPSDGEDARPGGLTARQQEVLDRLGLGKRNKVIARELSMCEATVKVHVRQIMRKLGASNRTEAALIWASATQDAAPAGEQTLNGNGHDDVLELDAEPDAQTSVPAVAKSMPAFGLQAAS